jgi:hypothetical protein
MSFERPPQFVRLQPSELAMVLRDESPSAAAKPLIIDVRGEDFEGGHIRSAVNVPEDDFEDDDDVDALVTKYKDQERIVFHCMMSQVRGPKCARRFLSRMAVVLDGQEHQPRVEVLTGGFQLFERVRTGRWRDFRHGGGALTGLLCVCVCAGCLRSTRMTRRSSSGSRTPACLQSIHTSYVYAHSIHRSVDCLVTSVTLGTARVPRAAPAPWSARRSGSLR